MLPPRVWSRVSGACVEAVPQVAAASSMFPGRSPYRWTLNIFQSSGRWLRAASSRAEPSFRRLRGCSAAGCRGEREVSPAVPPTLDFEKFSELRRCCVLPPMRVEPSFRCLRGGGAAGCRGGHEVSHSVPLPSDSETISRFGKAAACRPGREDCRPVPRLVLSARGHTTSGIPVLVRSPKSSGVGRGQYLDG